MRPIKFLLQLMLENKSLFLDGLCVWGANLCAKEIISKEEYKELLRYIENNRPSKWSSWLAFKNRNVAYYWKRGKINPRISWIKKHIKNSL